jgi:hypothetical protein
MQQQQQQASCLISRNCYGFHGNFAYIAVFLKAFGMHWFLMACFVKQYCQELVHPKCLLSCNKHCFLTQLVPIDLQFIAAWLALCD